jgi:membrane protein
MRAVARLQAEPRRPAAPSRWTLFCSGILVGMMLASEIVRAYRVKSNSAQRSANGASDCFRSSDDPYLVHRERADERGRGRHAETPWQIPWRGWKDILWRTYAQISEDRLLAVAAGVVFYGLLAVFPAIAALVSLYGLFASASAVGDHLSVLGGILPQGAVDLLREQIGRLTAEGGRLGLGFVFGLAVALWSANAGMKAIIDALNVVYKEKEKRSFIRLNLMSLAFTLAAIGALLVALGAVMVLPIALNYLGLENATELLFRLARWPLLLALAIVGLSVLYRLGSSRRQPRWQWISIGNVFAAVAWLISSALLSWYLASFADYNATYGSLGAGIGMMMWMWISSIVILFGAQLNSEIEHQTARHSTIHAEKPLGARGAVMADTVGKAQLRRNH